jgi:hypothetical protein
MIARESLPTERPCAIQDCIREVGVASVQNAVEIVDVRGAHKGRPSSGAGHIDTKRAPNRYEEGDHKGRPLLAPADIGTGRAFDR